MASILFSCTTKGGILLGADPAPHNNIVQRYKTRFSTLWLGTATQVPLSSTLDASQRLSKTHTFDIRQVYSYTDTRFKRKKNSLLPIKEKVEFNIVFFWHGTPLAQTATPTVSHPIIFWRCDRPENWCPFFFLKARRATQNHTPQVH